jgi:hypothetical protein
VRAANPTTDDNGRRGEPQDSAQGTAGSPWVQTATRAGPHGTGGVKPIDRVIDELKRLKKKPKGPNENGVYSACCPAHTDRVASLSVSANANGQVLLRCHTGCKAEAVVEALALKWTDLWPGDGPPKNGSAKGAVIAEGPWANVAEYLYRDEHGVVLYKVVRQERTATVQNADGSTGQVREKKFVQFRPKGDEWEPGVTDVRRVLFRVSQLLATPKDVPVYLVEGEKCVQVLVELGLVATTTSGGALAWCKADKNAIRNGFAGRKVVILPDNDRPGRGYAEDALRDLVPVAAEVQILDLPGLAEHGDVVDWLADDHTVAELEALAAQVAPERTAERAQYGRTSGQGNEGGSSASDDNGPKLVTTRLDSVRAELTEWLVEDRLPLGKVTMIAGLGGMGKSTWILSLIADLTGGRAAWGTEAGTDAVDVLLIAAEDGVADTIVPQLVTMRAELARVHRLDHAVIRGRRAAFDFSMVDALEQHLELNPAIKLVVIDPVSSYVGRAGVDDHKASELRGVLDHLHGMAERRRVAVILVAHVNKNDGRDASLRIHGSLAYRDTCRVVWFIGIHPTDETLRVIALNKRNVLGLDRRSLSFTIEHPADDEMDALMNHPATAGIPVAARGDFRKQLVRVVIRGAVELDSNDVMASGTAGKNDKATRSEQCEAWLRAFMGAFAWPDKEIEAAADKAGFGERMLRGVKQDLRKRGEFASRKAGFASGIWWNWFGTLDSRPPDRPTGHSDHSDHSDHSAGCADAGPECGRDEEQTDSDTIPTEQEHPRGNDRNGGNGQNADPETGLNRPTGAGLFGDDQNIDPLRK